MKKFAPKWDLIVFEILNDLETRRAHSSRIGLESMSEWRCSAIRLHCAKLTISFSGAPILSTAQHGDDV